MPEDYRPGHHNGRIVTGKDLTSSVELVYRNTRMAIMTGEYAPDASLKLQELAAILAKYPAAKQVYWVQEEPSNMGAWHFIWNQMRPILPDHLPLSYVGRRAAASPATGSYKIHQQEEADLINRAFAR